MFKRVWLLHCSLCRIVYGYGSQEIDVIDGQPYEIEDEDRKPLHCRVCGRELELLQQVGEW